MKFGSLCALGGFIPYPVMSALTHFPEDFNGNRSREAGMGREADRRDAKRRVRVMRTARSISNTVPTAAPSRLDAARSTSPAQWERCPATDAPRRPRHAPDPGNRLRHPGQRSARFVTLNIDGQDVTVPEGTSIMRAAMEAGVKIPKLCATDTLDRFGSCRVCLVEIEGRNGTPASCTTPVAPGMKVSTSTDRLRRLRRGVMELYLSDHPTDALTSPVAGNCEFQEMAGQVGVREMRYGPSGPNHLQRAR